MQWVSFFIFMELQSYQEMLAQKMGPAYLKQLRRKSWTIRISRDVWLNHMTGLSPVERCVLVTLKFYAGKFDRCWPGVRRLAKDLEMSTNTVLGAIRGLEGKKLISTKVRGRRMNLYTLGSLE